MRLFKKKQREEKQRAPIGVLVAVASYIEQLKRKLADFLGRQSEKLTVPQRKVMLLLFGLTIGSICVGLVIRPFAGDQQERFTIPTSVEAPKLIQPDAAIGKTDYQSLVWFKRVMDSLKHSPKGRAQYEQIMKERPGLLDSVHFILGSQ
jgi:hypothetical protein